MNDSIADIIGQYRTFAVQQRDGLLTRGIDISPYTLSHLAYRVPEWGVCPRPDAAGARSGYSASKTSGGAPIDLIGVPFNSSGTSDGVALAPAVLRHTGLVGALIRAGHAVVDRGDVGIPAMSPFRDSSSHVIAVDAIGPMIDAVRDAVAGSLAAQRLPLVIGGDCPVLIGCVAAVARLDTPRVLFVDGHEDAWPAERSPTGEAADMEVGWLLGRSIDTLPAALRRRLPRLSPDNIIVLGARDQAELAEAAVESIDGLVRTIRPEAINVDSAGVADAAVSELDARGPWWLHVDLDVLAADSLTAVDYPQPGGLDWPALTQITRRALASPQLLGWTITIYNPDLDPEGAGAERIGRYVAEALS